jgi:hypothetical protein
VVPRSELLTALLSTDDIFELGLLVPGKTGCGRPRMFPGYMYVLYNALLSVYTSGFVNPKWPHRDGLTWPHPEARSNSSRHG